MSLARRLCRVSFASLLSAALLMPGAALAQAPEVPASSPPAKVEQVVGISQVSVSYASPGVKGRQIFGGLVPYGEIWRTGANETTKFTSNRDFTFGGVKVPAGTYALFTIPGKTEWTVVLNSNTGTWGSFGYEQKTDVARVKVKPQTLGESRERLTVLFANTTDDSTRLDIEWEKVRVSVPVTFETNAFVLENIEKATSEAWRPHYVSARYLLETNGDLAKALELSNASIAIKSTWWNQWTKAQILGKQGKKAEAVAAAKEAQKVGAGERVYEGFYKGTIAKAIEGWK